MRYVLFVCTHNAGRSQMAQAFFERHAPADLRAESAGQDPAKEVWPQVVEAMREIGIDIGDRRPKRLTTEMQLHADWAITLACAGICPFVPTTVEDWDIPDPANRPLEEVRLIRDASEARVRELIDERIDLIRSDRTAHQLRLEKLLPDLVRGGRVERPVGLPTRACRRCCAEGLRVSARARRAAAAQLHLRPGRGACRWQGSCSSAFITPGARR